MSSARPTPLVSVIIPIYNAAEFLAEALDSIRAQTLREIEIICVDDGSTDDTPAILAEYAARDSRFVLLRQQNKFAGAARNHGMSVARGKYISFLDSDDLFAPEMFERMVSAAEKWEADIVHCQACEYYPDTGRTAPMHLIGDELLEHPEGPICMRRVLGNRVFQGFSTLTWNKLYLASFLRKHSLNWPDTLYAEDAGFVRHAGYLSERSVFLKDVFVRYRIREQSLSHHKVRDVSIYFQSYQILRDRLVACGANTDTLQSFDNLIWENILFWFIPTSTPATLEVFRAAFPEYDATHFHTLEQPADHFHSRQVYKRVQGFFRPAISFVVTDTPAWCMERKMESLSGLPFYDYEILFPSDSSDTGINRLLEAQVARNPRLRIVPCPTRGDAAAACCKAARGHILMHLPDNLKLRTGIAPALRQLAESPAQGEVDPTPYCTHQSHCELFYRSRSDRRSWCLFGKPVFTVFYSKEGGKKCFLLGRRLWNA